MEGHRDKVKGIDFLCIVVTFEVHEKCLFVG